MKTEKEIHQHRKDEHLSLAYKYWREEKNHRNDSTIRKSQARGLIFFFTPIFIS